MRVLFQKKKKKRSSSILECIDYPVVLNSGNGRLPPCCLSTKAGKQLWALKSKPNDEFSSAWQYWRRCCAFPCSNFSEILKDKIADFPKNVESALSPLWEGMLEWQKLILRNISKKNRSWLLSLKVKNCKFYFSNEIIERFLVKCFYKFAG